MDHYEVQDAATEHANNTQLARLREQARASIAAQQPDWSDTQVELAIDGYIDYCGMNDELP